MFYDFAIACFLLNFTPPKQCSYDSAKKLFYGTLLREEIQAPQKRGSSSLYAHHGERQACGSANQANGLPFYYEDCFLYHICNS